MAASSPPSHTGSHGESTVRDTPSTNVTSISPPDANKAARNVLLANLNEEQAKGPSSARVHDPFTTNALLRSSSALVPTAASFTPGQAQAFRVAPGFGKYVYSIGQPKGATGDSAHIRAGGITADKSTRTAPDDVNELTQAFGKVTVEARQAPDAVVPFRFSSIDEGIFTVKEMAKRAIKITGRSAGDQFTHLQAMFLTDEYTTFRDGYVVTENGVQSLLVRFHDIRDAIRAYGRVHQGRWQVQFINSKTYELEVAPAINSHAAASRVSNFDGSVKVFVLFPPQNTNITSELIMPLIKAKLASIGDVKAMKSFHSPQPQMKFYEVEFYDSRNTKIAVAQINASEESMYLADDVSITVELKADDVRKIPVFPLGAVVNGAANGINGINGVSPGLANGPSRLPTALILSEQPSVTGRSTVPVGDHATQSSWVYANQHPSPVRPFFSGGGNHNQVDITRIRLGVDVRTTVMLRNIPNRVDQAMLKEILDETSHAKYDFMYLRIDFANNCNVGYAFINFEDPLSIIDFHQSRAHRRWNRFGSDKVAEISYATIQGRDCLIQKFRNSSVMLEHPTFRPKLYATDNSENPGAEEVFPSPDNHFKMRRSVENAETIGLFPPGAFKTYGPNYREILESAFKHHHDHRLVFSPKHMTMFKTETVSTNGAYQMNSGLFAPRHGQQYRDDQRRRRSQFDRGTTAAENEARNEGLFDPARDLRPGAAHPQYGVTQLRYVSAPAMMHPH